VWFSNGLTPWSAPWSARYLPHPEHERVKLIVVPNLERVMVFDFTV
jgi:hypothetical protein